MKQKTRFKDGRMQTMKNLDTLPGNVMQRTAWSSAVTRWFSLAVALLLLLPAVGAMRSLNRRRCLATHEILRVRLFPIQR